MKNMKLTPAKQAAILEIELAKELEWQATLYKRYNNNMNRLNDKIKEGFQDTSEGSELQRVLSLSVTLQAQLNLAEQDIKDIQKEMQELPRVTE